MWTLFWDMHSGGGAKEPQTLIFIEKPEEIAKVVFYNRFGHNPERVTCTCCGQDYSISETETLEQATAYHRNCAWSDTENKYLEVLSTRWASEEKYRTVEEFEKEPHVLYIRETDIKPDECFGDAPEQGYVWKD
jgi:hypothetical protein